jgi:hypothetical protein
MIPTTEFSKNRLTKLLQYRLWRAMVKKATYEVSESQGIPRSIVGVGLQA